MQWYKNHFSLLQFGKYFTTVFIKQNENGSETAHSAGSIIICRVYRRTTEKSQLDSVLKN